MPGDKRRPVLVVSPDVRNGLASDVIVVPLTSVLRAGPWHVRLRKGEGGSGEASMIKCEQITTLRCSALLDQPLGSPLSGKRMAAVERGILRAIGLPIEEPE
jgi:mRNA-degrading endonuclease toxin of MazEF toxin-antitoxin module